MADKIRAAAAAEAMRIRDLTAEAARSGAYLYPFKGILYFLSHRSLWQPLTSRIGPTLTLGLSVTSAMFFFTYMPQAAILAFTSGPMAPISAALLVLSESSTIITALSRWSWSSSFWVEDGLVDTFDGTLVASGQEALVADGRQLSKAGSDPVGRLGKMLKRPFSSSSRLCSPCALLRSLLYLPLNFIPVVGTIMYLVVQGKRVGPVAHERYFQLKGWNAKQRDEWVERNRGAYTSFGIASFLLEMVPFASLAFSYTNTVGAALWAADIENSLRKQAQKVE
ncbi:hypothetical protein VTN77DRAFT_3138 [Rasamsonia byssochlamydoides]|uniref:uncharacterized protein n=1 Tax=Rasamsonia byssochlamydoides TaxID=89139 RepID=UPI00374250AF